MSNFLKIKIKMWFCKEFILGNWLQNVGVNKIFLLKLTLLYMSHKFQMKVLFIRFIGIKSTIENVMYKFENR